MFDICNMDAAISKVVGSSLRGWQWQLVRASKEMQILKAGQRVHLLPPCSVTLRFNRWNLGRTQLFADTRSALLGCSNTSQRALLSSTVTPAPATRARARANQTSEQSSLSQDCSDWDLEGWRVVLQDTGEEVGCVEEVLGIGCTSGGKAAVYEYSMLKVVDDINSPGLEVLVPWVDDIVKELDSHTRVVLIKVYLFHASLDSFTGDVDIVELVMDGVNKVGVNASLDPAVIKMKWTSQPSSSKPPDGLLELARRPEVLRNIRISLRKFGLHTEGQVEPHMPTRRQLYLAGEHELVEMIMSAGGFPSVAQALGFYSKRRPVGFWEDLQNVDEEIEAFVWESWREEKDASTGETHYVNLVTAEVVQEKPFPASVMNPIPVSQVASDLGTAVMPRVRTVKEAGRYDLHHAIMLHGGYKEVAQQLGRQTVCSHAVANLEQEILTFMQEHGLSLFPTPAQLLKNSRSDLLIAVRKSGGVNAVARNMGVRAQGNAKGHWASVEEAAVEMKAYMVEKMMEDQSHLWRNDKLKEEIWVRALKEGNLRLPSQAQILEDGRRDMRYVLQKFGQHAIADVLGIKNLIIRRPSRRHL